MPDMIAAFWQRNSPNLNRIVGVVEQAQLDLASVLREEREVGPVPIPGGSERRWESRPDLGQIRLSSAALNGANWRLSGVSPDFPFPP